MASLLDLLAAQLGPDTVAKLAAAIGAAPEQARKAVETALPLILEALQKNLSSVAGAADSGLLDRLFGGGRAAVEAAVAKASGLGGAAVNQLLALLTPLVLGVLGQARHEGGAEAGALGELAREALGRLDKALPDLGALLGSLLSGKR